MSECTSIKADWSRMKAMAAIFKSPSSLAYHVGKDLLINGKDIYHEIDTAIADYKVQNWADFGENVGMAAAKTILGKESQTKIKVAEVTQGIIKSFGGSFNLEALLECIYQEDQAALILDAAYNEFVTAYKTKNISDLIGGIIAVVAGVQQIKQGIPTCKAIDTTSWNYSGLDKSMNIMKNPTQNFKLLADDLFINGISVMEYAGKAAEAYGEGHYEVFGENMGEILKLATHVKEENVEKKTEAYYHIGTKDITEAAQGFFESASVGKFSYGNLLNCIQHNSPAIELFAKGEDTLNKAYSTKDMDTLISSTMMFVISFIQSANTLQGC